MSIRLRLTLLYSSILALTLVAFSATLYTIQSRFTLGLLKDDLALNAQRLTMSVGRVREWQDRPPPRPEFAARLGTMLTEQELRDLRVRDVVHVLDAEGQVTQLQFNQGDAALPLSDQGLETLQGGDTWTEIGSIEGERWLIYSAPLMARDQLVGIVQVARSLADRDRTMQALGGTLIAGTLLATLAAFGIGWVLSGITLRPIHRITQTAQAIGTERDLTRRVAYAGPNDELGQLATTFNAMLIRLQDAYRQVEKALQAQRNFVADVSHELRTPLTTIRGNLALLRRQPPIQDEERGDILADMVEETERLIRLVSDLLTLARADAGRRLEAEPVPLLPLAEDVCRQARLLAPGREIECAAPAEAAAFADRDALRQVLLILLDNALKHTAGPVAVTVAAEDGQVAISVRDTGPGMDAQTSARIFDRFYRGDCARSLPGFGLGLPIAQALVEAQEGTIAVQSQIDQGSVFTVTLPRHGPSLPDRGNGADHR
jgi:two-component system OmpR family sensor kinase